MTVDFFDPEEGARGHSGNPTAGPGSEEAARGSFLEVASHPLPQVLH